MIFDSLVKKVSFKTYLKNNFEKFCKELIIEKSYYNRLREELFKFDNYFICDENDFKNRILKEYADLLIYDLGLNDNKNKYFGDYVRNHQDEINILLELLYERKYKYNGFLFQNLLCLKESLVKPIKELDSINKYLTDEEDKEKFSSKLKEEIYCFFDDFFKVVIKLNNEYLEEIKAEKSVFSNSEALVKLKEYRKKLESTKYDLKKDIKQNNSKTISLNKK